MPCEGRGKAGQERQCKMGRLSVRERLKQLLDKDSPFFEIGLWPAYKMYDQWGKIPAAGVVTGIGNVESVPCMIVANDATVKAEKSSSCFPCQEKSGTHFATWWKVKRIFCVGPGRGLVQFQSPVGRID